jgi:hypothetical protein
MTYKVQGIILSKKDIRDVDRQFVLYTFQRGKIEVLAKGARKIESKLSGNLELLNHAMFTVGKGRTIDRVATVDVMEAFQPIKNNLFSLSAALYCFEIFNSFVKWEERDEPLFLLLLDFLETLQNTNRTATQKTLAHLFLLKFSHLLGLYEVRHGRGDIHRTIGVGSLADCMKHTLPVSQIEEGAYHFIENHCDSAPRSQCYFDLLSSQSKTIERILSHEQVIA